MHSLSMSWLERRVDTMKSASPTASPSNALRAHLKIGHIMICTRLPLRCSTKLTGCLNDAVGPGVA